MVCVARYEAFPTMMTGNVLQISRTLAANGLRVNDAHRMPSPFFFLLIICWRHFGLLVHYMAQKTNRKVFVVSVMILNWIMAEFALFSNLFPEAWNVWFVAFAYGVQTAQVYPVIGKPSFVATGHLTNICNTCVAVCFGDKPRSELKEISFPVVNVSSLMLGALIGALASLHSQGTVASNFLLTPSSILQIILMVLFGKMAHDRGHAARIAASATRTDDLELVKDLDTEDY